MEQKKIYFDISEFNDFLNSEYLSVLKDSEGRWFNIPAWFILSEEHGDKGVTKLANELLYYVQNYIEPDALSISEKESLVKFLTYKIYKPEDISKLLEVRTKFLSKDAKLHVWLSFLSYIYFQNKIMTKPPKINIQRNYVPGSLGASYDIVENKINIYTNHYHMQLNSSFITVALIHEMAHYLFTIEKDIYNKEKLKKSLELLSRPHGFLINLMEDIRIDNKISNMYPIIKNLYINVNSILKKNELPFIVDIAVKNLSEVDIDDKKTRKMIVFNHLNNIIKMYDMLPSQNLNEYFVGIDLTAEEKEFVNRYLVLVNNVKNAKNVEEVALLVEQFLKDENITFDKDEKKQLKSKSISTNKNNNGKIGGSNEEEEQEEEYCSDGESEKKQDEESEKSQTADDGNNGEETEDTDIQKQKNDISELIDKLIKALENNKLQSGNKIDEEQDFSQSGFPEAIEKQLDDYFEGSIKKFIEEGNIEQRIKAFENKIKHDKFKPAYGSPVLIDLSKLTTDERYFLYNKDEVQPTEDLIKAYTNGLKDGFSINVYLEKKIFYDVKGSYIDLKRYANLMGKIQSKKPIEKSDLNIFKNKTFVVDNENIPVIDCVVDTSGSMRSWCENANLVLAYMMGLQDALIDKKIFKLNIYLIRGDGNKNLCLDFDAVLRKVGLKNKDKFTLQSTGLLNNISYSGGAEGLSGYLETEFNYKKPQDHILFITDAHFVNVKDWSLLNRIKNIPVFKRPYLIGLYVLNKYEQIKNIVPYMEKAFDEHYASTLVTMNKICKKIINKAVEIQLKNLKTGITKQRKKYNYVADK